MHPHCTLAHTALSQLLCHFSEPNLCMTNALCLYERWVQALFSIICHATKHRASSTFPKDGSFTGLQWISQGTRALRTNLVHAQLEPSKPMPITTWLHGGTNIAPKRNAPKWVITWIANSFPPFPSQTQHGENSAVLVVGLSWDGNLILQRAAIAKPLHLWSTYHPLNAKSEELILVHS